MSSRFSMVSSAMRKAGITCRGTPPRDFSRSKSVYDLITRRYIREQEGANEEANIAKYQDPDSPEYKGMVEYIRKNLGLSSLAYQRLDDLVAAIGLPKDRICTYCFDGRDPSLAGSCPNCPHAQK